MRHFVYPDDVPGPVTQVHVAITYGIVQEVLDSEDSATKCVR
jgi:hypothetical protein